jgi:hypothetical protein
MAEIWYTASEKFDPAHGAEWAGYFEWAKIPQLRELISLDTMRRTPELNHLNAADWEHNVQQNYLTHFFRDLDYLLERLNHIRGEINILAACQEPEFEMRGVLKDPRFEFAGYDLIGFGDISAITNCGGFDQAFQTADISGVGLFDTFELARQVQDRLRRYYPNEHHADCDVWAIWRMTSG